MVLVLVVRNRGFDLSSLLNSRDLSSYSRSMVTGHRRWFAVKAGKINSASSLDCRDYFTSEMTLPRGGIFHEPEVQLRQVCRPEWPGQCQEHHSLVGEVSEGEGLVLTSGLNV